MTRRTVRGMAWAYGSYAAGRLLGLLATVLLARLLTPADFGLVAMALIFTALLDNLSDLGVSQALVVVKDEDVREQAETAWLFTVLLGAGLSIAIALLAPLAAKFFHEPGLVAIMRVLGLTFFLRALGMTHYALAQKQMDFRSRSIAELADVVTRGATGIVLAVAGFGAWSLVLGYLIGTLALTACLWALVPWRPSFRPRREHLRSLLHFGGALTAVNVLWAVVVNVDYAFVGRVLGPTALGLYSLGFRLPELLIQNLSVVAGRVLFPAFAAMQGEELRRGFLTSMRYTLLLALPMGVGLVLLAEPLIHALFGPRWGGAVPVMQVLTVHAIAVTLAIPAGTVYKALGRADLILWFSVPRTLLVVASVAIFVDRGIVAVATCQAVVNLTVDVVGIVMASRLIGVRPSRIRAALWPPLVAASGLGLAVALVQFVIAPTWPAFAASVVVGGAVYLGLVWVLARDVISDLGAIARRRPAPGIDPRQPEEPHGG